MWTFNRSYRSIDQWCWLNCWSSSFEQSCTRSRDTTCISYAPALCLSCSYWHLSLQSLELSCSMTALAWTAHHRRWRWLLRGARECPVRNLQDQCPLQWSGTTHKANWCRGTAGMRWIKLVAVVELHFSTSKGTNKTKVEGTSAEWLVQGTTRRSCLFALVSAILGLGWLYIIMYNDCVIGLPDVHIVQALLNMTGIVQLLTAECNA